MDDKEYLEDQIVRLSDRISELENTIYRMKDDIRGIRYTAEDAEAKLENTIYRMKDDIRGIRYTAEDAEAKAREAKDAADRAQRGW